MVLLDGLRVEPGVLAAARQALDDGSLRGALAGDGVRARFRLRNPDQPRPLLRPVSLRVSALLFSNHIAKTTKNHKRS